MTTAGPLLVLSPSDCVAVARRELAAGETVTVTGREVVVRDAVAVGHKVAITDVAAGAPVT